MPEPQEIEVGGVVGKYYSDEDFAAMQTEYEEKLKIVAPSESYKAMRDKIDLAEQEARELREKLEKTGESEKKPLTQEEITEQVSLKIRTDMVNELVTDKLSDYDEETSKLVKHYYDKLVTGETVTNKNVSEFIAQAERLAMPDKPKFNPLTVGVGGTPEQGAKPGFADSDEGKGVADAMGLKFHQVKQ